MPDVLLSSGKHTHNLGKKMQPMRMANVLNKKPGLPFTAA